MKREAILKGSFFIGLAMVVFGAVLKILHRDESDTLMALGLIATLIFMVLTIYEVNTSARIERSEKIMWTVGFLFMGTITGIIYLLIGRKRVVEPKIIDYR